jgi:hypothetical protein
MLSNANKPFMLSVFMVNVVMLSVLMLSVIMLNVVIMSVIMLGKFNTPFLSISLFQHQRLQSISFFVGNA